MIKFKQVFLASVLASSMVVTPVFADDVSNLQNSKNAAQSEVNSLQSELQTLIEKMSKLEDDLVSTGQQITQAQDDLTVAEEKEHQQYEDMKKRIKYMYEEGNSTAIETLVSAENFSDLLNKAEYVQNVHSYDRKQLQEYIDTKQQIADLKAQLEEDQANLESMQSDYEAEQTTLSNTLESKKEEVADLDEQLQAAVAAAEAKRQAEEAAKAAKAAESTKSHSTVASTSNSGSQTVGNTTNNNGNNNTTVTPSAPSTPSTPSTPTVTPDTSNNNSSSNNGGSTYGNGSAILSAAAAYLGVPYVWSGTSGSGVDCSGLVYLAHQACGIPITRNSYSQGSGGQAVSDPQPGDVVCYGGHVGIYAGGGQMIHAPQPGEVVCYTSVNYAYHWYRRYW